MNEKWMDTCTWVHMIVHISVFFFSPHVVLPFYKLFRLAKCCWIFDPIAVFPVNCCRYFKSICCLLTVLFASQSWEPESWADMKIRDPQHLTPKTFYNLGTLGCTKTHENNALQPSHLTGRSHWDTFPLFFGSCGKRRHRWCCTEPPCQQSMASHVPHCHCKRNKLSTLSPINISIAILLGFLLFVFLLLVSFPSWDSTRVYPITWQAWNLHVTRWWIIKVPFLETTHDLPQGKTC